MFVFGKALGGGCRRAWITCGGVEARSNRKIPGLRNHVFPMGIQTSAGRSWLARGRSWSRPADHGRSRYVCGCGDRGLDHTRGTVSLGQKWRCGGDVVRQCTQGRRPCRKEVSWILLPTKLPPRPGEIQWRSSLLELIVSIRVSRVFFFFFFFFSDGTAGNNQWITKETNLKPVSVAQVGQTTLSACRAIWPPGRISSFMLTS